MEQVAQNLYTQKVLNNIHAPHQWGFFKGGSYVALYQVDASGIGFNPDDDFCQSDLLAIATIRREGNTKTATLAKLV